MSDQPLCIDLFCGLGGWTEGFLSEGYRVIGFDIERHQYGAEKYPAQLVLQDVRTLHGSQFKNATIIVASSPCQEFSYRAMPWKRAKALGPPLLGMELFAQAARIQREAIDAAGRFIPMIQENVRGAQPWVGRAQWHYGSYYLWGDVPALMPPTQKAVKVPTMGAGWYPPDHPKHAAGLGFNTHAARNTKNTGGSWFNVAHNTTSGKGQNPDGRKTRGLAQKRDGMKVPSESGRRTDIGNGARFTSRESSGVKQHGSGRDWFAGPGTMGGTTGSKSSARKAASARIAKIPFPLASHIARTYREVRAAA